MRSVANPARGFTLLEVLGALVIMGILVASLAPLLLHIQRHQSLHLQRHESAQRLMRWTSASLAALGPGVHVVEDDPDWVLIIGPPQRDTQQGAEPLRAWHAISVVERVLHERAMGSANSAANGSDPAAKGSDQGLFMWRLLPLARTGADDAP